MKKFIIPFLISGLSAVDLSGCTGSGNTTNIELIQDMYESPAIKAQEFDLDSPHHSGLRVPPDNTVPVGFVPYKYSTQVDLAAKELKNPFAGQETPEVLSTGIKYFETNCAVCHGHHGEGGEAGKTVVSTFMALKPPSLLSDKVRNMTDGNIYHIITMGQGLMGPYASHIPQASRWQVVTYIRQLQKRAAK